MYPDQDGWKGHEEMKITFDMVLVATVTIGFMLMLAMNYWLTEQIKDLQGKLTDKLIIKDKELCCKENKLQSLDERISNLNDSVRTDFAGSLYKCLKQTDELKEKMEEIACEVNKLPVRLGDTINIDGIVCKVTDISALKHNNSNKRVVQVGMEEL